MEMTPETFWNIVLYTKGHVEMLHSYRVKCWPEMRLAFIKAHKNAMQLAKQATRLEEQKRKREYYDDYFRSYGWDKGHEPNKDYRQEKASSSQTGG
eukprot:16450361-Heterocapsa_arctica.AAC.1